MKYINLFLTISEILGDVCDGETEVRFVMIVFVLQFSNPDFSTAIHETVDTVIQNCPIDVRRGLYKVCLYILYQ